jgi:hypothetical protein
MTEDKFWIELEFRICLELRGMSDPVLRLMCCDGISGDSVRFPTYQKQEGHAYLYGTIYIGKTGQTPDVVRQSHPKFHLEVDLVWNLMQGSEELWKSWIGLGWMVQMFTHSRETLIRNGFPIQ